ncbi:kynurenine/alpha-aminoadipate aminotransferase, mitochondrial-like isoform X2 [Nomia melanderi]|uniref:kynurenine/alpha-aminoadipate aminotransferase, mitochondrial-like isoform X2 n=1 Tax=Nomia melanderi TaxID=2448451 RepID=UPI0013046015|nr:kynurenine/alpha-aminoadipate aminotransferase, mitochondrial-like isoform X2 [Nomia melanderi]XP_031831656.1 kynurenine/alpha-aminoadipate aminotransferase, mitochondrial-like isoform X2 [Nomia melanderi]
MKNIVCNIAKKFAETPNAVNLANGMPNATTFPFEDISVKFKDGNEIKLVGEELIASLQYCPSQGYLPLLKKMREYQEYWHKPKQNEWDVIFTSGSLDGCSKVFEMTLEIGDPMMIQVPCYEGVLHSLAPLMPEFLEIGQDQDGIIPDEIEKTCKERLQNGKPMPKIIYINPIANPTGTVLTESRRKKVYELAQRYDFLIVEDDPYCFLHFLEKRPVSFLGLDTDCRVIRLDSFSKIFSAGLRLGVVTAHRGFIKKLVLHMETTSIHASALSQMLLYKLLCAWDMQTLQQHYDSVQKFYLDRRDIMLASVQKHLTGLAEWNVPNGGMFVWIKIPGINDTMELVKQKCVSHGIFLLPGHAFNCDFSKPDQYVRLSYSYATPEEIEKALSTIATIIHEEITKQK